MKSEHARIDTKSEFDLALRGLCGIVVDCGPRSCRWDSAGQVFGEGRPMIHPSQEFESDLLRKKTVHVGPPPNGHAMAEAAEARSAHADEAHPHA